MRLRLISWILNNKKRKFSFKRVIISRYNNNKIRVSRRRKMRGSFRRGMKSLLRLMGNL